MYSSESEEEEKIDDLWALPSNEEDKTAEELSKEKEKEMKKTRKLLQTL